MRLRLSVHDNLWVLVCVPFVQRQVTPKESWNGNRNVTGKVWCWFDWFVQVTNVVWWCPYFDRGGTRTIRTPKCNDGHATTTNSGCATTQQTRRSVAQTHSLHLSQQSIDFIKIKLIILWTQFVEFQVNMLPRTAHSLRHFNRALLAVSLILLSIAIPSSKAHILGQTRRLETVSQRSVEVINKSGRRVDVLWVNSQNPKQEEFVTQSENGDGVAYGAAASINSYVGHTFEVREMPGKNSGKCLEETCWKGRFTVSTEHEQGMLRLYNFCYGSVVVVGIPISHTTFFNISITLQRSASKRVSS